MAVITQYYDIDLRATGEYPVVKMSQFDTGSRTIVFTVHDGHELAQIDGMIARVDGTRCDGVEFSQSCTVSTGSKVSFTISQEITKVSGKHTAELVIFDADGNPIGTQNFVIEVESAVMRRDAAASADDRTLYDQFTDSVSKTVTDKMTQMGDSVSKTVNDKMASVDSKMAGVDTQISTTVDNELDKRIKTDPLLGAWSDYTVDGTASFSSGWTKQIIPLKIKRQSDGSNVVYGSNTANSIYIYKPGVYQLMMDGWYISGSDTDGRNTILELVQNGDNSAVKRVWTINSAHGIGSKTQLFRGSITFCVPDDGLPYRLNVYTAGGSTASLEDGWLSQMVITRISSTWTPNVASPGVATSDKAGIVKPGTGLTVAADGTLSAEAYTLPPATPTTLGGVKIGYGLNVDSDGILSLRTSGYMVTQSLWVIALVHRDNDSSGITFDHESFHKILIDDADALALNPAAASTLGGVKIGAGINVSADGTIDVQALIDRISALESKVAALEAK